MFKNIVAYLADEGHHRKIFIFLIISGVLSRIFYGFYSYGPAFLDEYLVIILPALEKVQIGTAIGTDDYRNLLYPHIYSKIYSLVWSLGFKTPAIATGFGNAVTGLFSVLGLWGLYRFSRNFLSAGGSLAVLFLGVFHPVMPVLSTKPLIESFSMFVVPWAFYFITKEEMKIWDFFWAGIFTGLAAFFRIQSGIIVAGISLTLVFWLLRKKITGREFLIFHLGGLTVLIMLGLTDSLFGRPFMSSTWKYVELNFLTNVSSNIWGKTPWFMYITLFMSMMVPPFSLLLLLPFFRSWKGENGKAAFIFFIFIAFVFIHSLIENKLERFMAPVIPLFFFLTILGYEMGTNQKLKLWESRFLWISGIVMVLIFPAVLTQRSQITTLDAAGYLREANREKWAVYKPDDHYWFQAYYGLDYPWPMGKTELNAAFLLSKDRPFYFLTYKPLAKEAHCRLQKVFQPDLVEALAFKFNPERNERRAPLMVYLCKK